MLLFNIFSSIMGVVYSYFGGAEQEKRIRSLERVISTMAPQIETLERTVRQLKHHMEEQKLLFQWDENTILCDPKKVLNIQMDNKYNSDLEREEESFENTEAFMKAKGFKTEKEIEAYVDAHRIYTFKINHNHVHYRREFRNKMEADAFSKRIGEWTGVPMLN